MRKEKRVWVGLTVLMCLGVWGFTQDRATIRVDNKPVEIGSDLFGIFFEDINYAADGGLYPERVQNRSFEYSRSDNQDWNALSYWQVLVSEPEQTSVMVETSQPLNANNPHYAVLTIKTPGLRNGLSNEGFDGIALTGGDKYDISLYARVLEGTPGPITVRIENSKNELVGEAQFDGLKTEWIKHTSVIEAKSDATSGRLLVLVGGTGKLALDMVSLFPQKTFKNRPNGLRPDLAQVIADLKPKFIRFPGGCLVHGDGLENMYRWKHTIGPIEERKAQRNIWRYHQTLGLGYYEYFQFCEDIGAKPLPVVAAGVCCQNSGGYLNLVPKGQRGISMDQMDEYVQEVLDLIEWANGPADSTWGAKRAAAGHPAPFGLKYLGVGNEDVISPVFKERYKMINDAIKAKHPEIVVIGTTGPFTDGRDYEEGWKFAREEKLPMVDEHGYKSPEWFWENLERFDNYERTGTQVYLGEYAAHDSGRENTLRSALAEAAYMTSLERNGDLVRLSSYAPLLSKERRTQWRPDLIYFDNVSITPSINYYVQQLFSVNCGDIYLPTKVEIDAADEQAEITNGVLLGTWDTQAVFDDIQVVSSGKKVLEVSFEQRAAGWEPLTGQWHVADGVYKQDSKGMPALSMFTFEDNRSGYTLTLKAMKTGGSEGFLIGFGVLDKKNYYWLNLGGWGNTRHGIEKSVDDKRSQIGLSPAGHIETNRWYDIQVAVTGQRIECYLDGKLIIKLQDSGFMPTPDVAASTVRDSKSGDVIVKIVSKSDRVIKAQLDLSGLGAFKSNAIKTVLSGQAGAVNRFGQAPEALPNRTQIEVSERFEYDIPAQSLTVIRMAAAK